MASTIMQFLDFMDHYAVLRHIYGQRQAHKLDEWREFCAWAETLPYGKELIVPKE